MQLQHLTFQSGYGDYWQRPDSTTLNNLSVLESLNVLEASGPSLRNSLTNMSRLTELSMICQPGHQQEDWDSVLSLSGLRSLTACFRRVWTEARTTFVLHSLHRLSLLTSLTVLCASSGVSLSCLTNLVELCLSVQRRPLIEIQEALAHLTNLEYLVLTPAEQTYAGIESIAFSRLKKLRKLYLRGTWLDDNFVPTLADLPNLKWLILIGSLTPERISSFLNQLSLLTNVETLAFHPKRLDNVPIDIRACTFLPEGSLPKLRDLRLSGGCTQDERIEVFRRLPSLRRFMQ